MRRIWFVYRKYSFHKECLSNKQARRGEMRHDPTGYRNMSCHQNISYQQAHLTCTWRSLLNLRSNFWHVKQEQEPRVRADTDGIKASLEAHSLHLENAWWQQSGHSLQIMLHFLQQKAPTMSALQSFHYLITYIQERLGQGPSLYNINV